VFKSLPFTAEATSFNDMPPQIKHNSILYFYSHVLYVMPLPLFGAGSMGTLSYGKYLYVVYPIPTQSLSRHPIMQKRQMQKLLVLTVQANRRAVFPSITLPKYIV
jgi:hypothetical protein